MTPPADAVARLTKLADDYASRGDFATEDDIHALIAAYADAARDRERLEVSARGAIATAAMMLAKLGGSATFTPLEQIAAHDRVSRTDEPDGSFTLTLDAARTGEAR